MIEQLRATAPDDAAPAAPKPVSAPELAAQLAGKLCHDFISPASAITSGLDLLEDPTAQDMREEAIGLITASARKLVALLAFDRVAFGTSSMAENFSSGDLETLTRGVFAHVRAELDWAVEAPVLNKPAARTLLNMAQLASAALPTGGTARISARLEGMDTVVETESRGPRARLRPEVQVGLRGEPLVEGLGGQWVQSYYLSTLVAAAGGELTYELGEDVVRLRARVPA